MTDRSVNMFQKLGGAHVPLTAGTKRWCRNTIAPRLRVEDLLAKYNVAASCMPSRSPGILMCQIFKHRSLVCGLADADTIDRADPPLSPLLATFLAPSSGSPQMMMMSTKPKRIGATAFTKWLDPPTGRSVGGRKEHRAATPQLISQHEERLVRLHRSLSSSSSSSNFSPATKSPGESSPSRGSRPPSASPPPSSLPPRPASTARILTRSPAMALPPLDRGAYNSPNRGSCPLGDAFSPKPDALAIPKWDDWPDGGEGSPQSVLTYELRGPTRRGIAF